MKTFLLALMLLISGCKIIPKAVEFGQDKVERYPVAKASENEIQRQAAQRAAAKSEETLRAALIEGSSSVVVQPAKEASVLTDAVANSLGVPLKPASADLPSADLARKLDTAVAKLNSRIDDFKEDNNANVGHKIEDTGFFKVPYFVYLGGFIALLLVGLVIAGLAWTALKMYAMSNPPIALGLKAVSTGGALAAKAVGQLVRGGETFKDKLASEIPELSEAVQLKIKELFRSSQERAQDESVQSVVKELTS